MKFLALEHEIPSVNPPDINVLLKEEAAHVYALYEKGTVREIYFTENHEAILILECDSQTEAETIVNEFPLAKAGCLCFEVKSLLPYSGFNRLFASKQL